MSRLTTLLVLLGGAAVLLLGNGLFGTLLGVRASLEAFGIATTGTIMSAYFLGYAVGTFLCANAIERVGHIRAFAAFSAVLAAIAIAHAIFVAPLVWGVFRFVAGLCVVGFFLVIESWLNGSAPPKQRGRVFSVYMTVNLLAVAAGQYLLLLADPADFVLFGVVTILFALSLVPIALTRLDAPPIHATTGLGLRQLYAGSPIGVIGSLICGFVGGSFWGMGPVFAAKMGLTGTGIAAFMSAVIIGGMLAQWPVGALSDRRDRRKVIVAVAVMGAFATAVITIAAAWSLTVFLAMAFVFGTALFPLYSLAVARTHDVMGTEKVLEVTRGLILVSGVGAVLGPIVSGWVMEAFAPLAIFVLFALIFAAFAAFSAYRISIGTLVPADEQSAFVPLLRTSPEAVEMAEMPNMAAEPRS